MWGKALAEFSGTAILVAVVVGSGFMGDALSADAGVALVINALSTMLALALLILVIGPISGAHFNPVVTLAQLAGRTISGIASVVFIGAQTLGAIAGAVTANLMFLETVGTMSTNGRLGIGTFIGEVLATAGLIAIIGILSKRGQGRLLPIAVAAWIGSAYFFTSSTSFANPAVTVGRMFTESFAGIAPASVPGFVCAQLLGAAVGAAVVYVVTHQEKLEN